MSRESFWVERVTEKQIVQVYRNANECKFPDWFIRTSQGFVANTDAEKADVFSEYFSSVFTYDNHMPEFGVHVNNSVQRFSCSVADVIKTIGKLRSHSSPG